MLRQSVKILIEQRFHILIPTGGTFARFEGTDIDNLHKRQCWQQRK